MVGWEGEEVEMEVGGGVEDVEEDIEEGEMRVGVVEGGWKVFERLGGGLGWMGGRGGVGEVRDVKDRVVK